MAHLLMLKSDKGTDMPIVEDIKHVAEAVSGFCRPAWEGIRTTRRKPNLYRFKDDGETPNNPKHPLIHYRGAVKLDLGSDPAAIFEVLFKHHGWIGSWRDGIYDFNHFH